MDSLTLACVLSDLSRSVGSRVRSVHADGPVAARIAFPAVTFLFDAAPDACTAWLAPPEEGKAGDRRAAAFAEGLRAALAGAELAGVAVPGGDRVARLDFTSNRFGKEVRHALVLEFMGKHANALLLDGDGRIALAAREMNLERRGGPGELWSPFGGRRDLSTLEAADLGPGDAFDPPAALADLARRFAGIHPELALDLATLPPEGLVDALRALGRFFATLDPAHLPCRVRFDTVKTKVTGRLDPSLPSSPPAAGFPGASAAQAAATEARRDRAARRTALDSIGARLRKAEKDLALARADAEAAADFERPKRMADLLLAFADRVERVAPDRGRVPDYEGGTVEVPLDPRFDLKGNRERLYRRYKRMKRSRAAGLERAEANGRRVVELRAAFASVEAGGPIPVLPAPALARRGENKRKAAPVGKRAKGVSAASRLFRESSASTGHRIYVGRSARGNDYVTTRLARPWDCWFHAKGVRGSHVVLRVERDETPPDEAVREAACLAAFHSDARNGSRILVSMTRRRDVRKVPGTPGLVLLNREETLLVEPSGDFPGDPAGGGARDGVREGDDA